MPYYLAFDSGGSKSRAILFDERGPLGFGLSGGTNTNFTTPEDCRRNIADCLTQALGALDASQRPVIDTVYAVIVGPLAVLAEELAARATVGEVRQLGEGQAAVLAGALSPVGMAAMSGTGSDAFYTGPGGTRGVVGALGAILGDDGSGAWIGQQALRRALAYGEGWGEPTVLSEMIFADWGFTEKWDLVNAVYRSHAPFRKVASVLPVVGAAARRGDAVALSILEEAGRLMAVQVAALIRRECIVPEARFCVCCGGAWKAHPAMFDAFRAHMRASNPDVPVSKPIFEHVMAGVVLRLLEAEPALSQAELCAALEGPYQALRITW